MDELIKAAIPALLNDEQAKKALLDYIKSLTEKVHPKEEWREVWWQLSDDVRRENRDDPYSGIKNPECKLFCFAHYSNRNIGLIVAQLVPSGYAPNDRWRYYDHNWNNRDFHRETIVVDGYVDVIIAAQSAWTNLYAKWVAATLPSDAK